MCCFPEAQAFNPAQRAARQGGKADQDHAVIEARLNALALASDVSLTEASLCMLLPAFLSEDLCIKSSISQFLEDGVINVLFCCNDRGFLQEYVILGKYL